MRTPHAFHLLLLATLAASALAGGDGARVLPFGAEHPAHAPHAPPSSTSITTTAPPGGWTAKAFPNPNVDPVACGRPSGRRHGSWVCDPDGLLSGSGADAVEGLLRDVAGARAPYAPAPCDAGGRATPGYQVGVALADKLAVPDSGGPSSAAEAAEGFARAVMDAWGVGAAGCDDGALIVASRSDKQIYILAGRGASALLPPSTAAAIIAAMGSRLRERDWDGAVRGAAADVGLALAGAGPPDSGGGGGGGGGFDWGLLLFAGIFAGIAGSGLRAAAARRREVGAVRGLLDKLRREREGAAAAAAYPAESCPVCLEDFEQGGGGGGGGAGPAALEGPHAAAPVPSPVPAPAPCYGGDGDGDGDGAAAAAAPLLPGGGRMAGAAPAALTTTATTPVRRPLALPCGHTFCEPCLTRWLDGGGHTTCPICRAVVTAAGAPAAAAAPAAAGGGGGGAHPPPRPRPAAGYGPPVRRPWDPDLYAPELLFRLGSVRRLYPALVGAEVLDGWARAVARGEAPSPAWADDARAFALRDGPTARRQAREGGSWGARAGFGGGGSAGASGAGGTW